MDIFNLPIFTEYVVYKIATKQAGTHGFVPGRSMLVECLARWMQAFHRDLLCISTL